MTPHCQPQDALHGIGQVLYEWDQFDALEWLDEAQLEVWSEFDEPYAILGEDFAQYTVELRYARMTLPAEHFGSVSVDVLRAATEEALGSLDGFWIIEGDWPDEPALGAAIVRPRPARPADWHGMAFRSQAELRVAEALERAGVVFFPNARGRVGVTADARETREPDFIVIAEGRFGILEVDGSDYHDGNAAQDHERDRCFRHHGVPVLERFPAKRCFDMPDDVVAEFLRLLRRNG
jgi:hypothetical protein